ncbi:metal ABC transporter solute-binding protein, Zn/Mn family [Anaerocolumna xylanovorans]|uniref:Manganese/zinc/iron transport system substrate-binding protein n=1 Tax=Anaerocolumna xylanovorans DSM 12503 TaxID=1121345 RepID=A0A1M7XW19_9FIRM|nr:zinc ABC transporter substrate-binding protein [Anaerocolumna xylanovorans]SHO42887.1 manganese/zinc/iron transport system substrate-binding protein [Anaerocolumna xylanovorans DSM 12503]
MIRNFKILFSLSIIAVLFLTSCQKTEPKETADTLNIVATTTMLADLSGIIGGEHVTVNGLMGPGIDPHLYQASAGDVTLMQNADVVVYNGLHLEGKMGEIFESLTDRGRTVICIEDGLNEEDLLSWENDTSIHDPHIWFDVSLWKDAAKTVADKLSAADPPHGEDYANNLEEYLVELDDLDTYIKDKVNEIPKEQRVLITAHDAFNYFGRAYGFEVKGLQGISTDAEAGTADVSSLAGFITERKIKAIFVESSVPPKTIEALQAAVKAKGFDVSIGGELYSDSLGGKDSGAETYILTVRANIDTIVKALK